jgi:antitoxin (DNA-binding transcriptional repressor) of toxin-antitoxin stability system
MKTVDTGELRQNPQVVIRRVLATGQPEAVTAYGRPTGVVIAPDKPKRRTWVPGEVLRQAIRPLPDAESQAWLGELETARKEGLARDLVVSSADLALAKESLDQGRDAISFDCGTRDTAESLRACS